MTTAPDTTARPQPDPSKIHARVHHRQFAKNRTAPFRSQGGYYRFDRVANARLVDLSTLRFRRKIWPELRIFERAALQASRPLKKAHSLRLGHSAHCEFSRTINRRFRCPIAL